MFILYICGVVGNTPRSARETIHAVHNARETIHTEHSFMLKWIAREGILGLFVSDGEHTPTVFFFCIVAFIILKSISLLGTHWSTHWQWHTHTDTPKTQQPHTHNTHENLLQTWSFESPIGISRLRLGQASYCGIHRGRTRTSTALAIFNITYRWGGAYSDGSSFWRCDLKDSKVGGEKRRKKKKKKNFLQLLYSRRALGIRMGMTGSNDTGIMHWSFLGVIGYGAVVELTEIHQSCFPVSVLKRWPA